MKTDPIRRILYAPNVHQGGGKALLLPLLDQLKHEADLLFVLDRRMETPGGWSNKTRVIRVDPSLTSRLATEWRLRALINPDMKVLCMGNLPPLLVPNCRTTVFLQNRYLTGRPDLSEFPLSIRLRIGLERAWLRLLRSSISRFIVQTPSMQQELKQTLACESDILPFVGPDSLPPRVDPSHKRHFDFVYVASGEPHKNHRNLIRAWIILAKRGRFPSLRLTLNQERFPELLRWIEKRRKIHRLTITNAGELSPEAINALYRSAGALVYPSRFESFGLPLFEAAAAGLPILAADRSYVHDLISQPETFDPEDPCSLAQAVESFSFLPSKPAIRVIDAKTFVEKTFAR